jgi:hypothetical protein
MSDEIQKLWTVSFKCYKFSMSDVSLQKSSIQYSASSFCKNAKLFSIIMLDLQSSGCNDCQCNYHASLLNSSIEQVNCVGGMAGIETTPSKSNNWTLLSPCQCYITISWTSKFEGFYNQHDKEWIFTSPLYIILDVVLFAVLAESGTSMCVC